MKRDIPGSKRIRFRKGKRGGVIKVLTVVPPKEGKVWKKSTKGNENGGHDDKFPRA